MNDYDINLLRPLREEGRRGRAGRLVPLLFAAGLLFYGLYAASSLGAARARLDREASLLEREKDLARRSAEADSLFQERRTELRERRARIPWRAVLGSVARALPAGGRIDRIVYDGEEGWLALVWSPADPGAPDRYARALRADSLLMETFPFVRPAGGGGEGEPDTLLLRRREER